MVSFTRSLVGGCWISAAACDCPLYRRFLRPSPKIIIELDGSQHLDQQAYDAERTDYLQKRGYKVLRFWKNHVLNHLGDVLNAILAEIE